MAKIVVFDFDGTLIVGDTFAVLKVEILKYLFLRNRCLCIKYLFYVNIIFLFALIHKKYLINYKKFLIQMALKCDELYIFRTVLDKLEINKLVVERMQKHIVDANTRVIIVTGSTKYFVNCLFPNVECLALDFVVVDESVEVLQHPYGKTKVELLKTIGISAIDIFYTDSNSDIPSMGISKSVFFVVSGKVKIIK